MSYLKVFISMKVIFLIPDGVYRSPITTESSEAGAGEGLYLKSKVAWKFTMMISERSETYFHRVDNY